MPYDAGKKYELAMQQCEKYGGRKGMLPVVTEGVYVQTKVDYIYGGLLRRASVFLNSKLKYVEFSGEAVYLPGREFDPYGPYFRKRRTPFSYYRAYLSESGDPLCEPYERALRRGDIYFSEAELAANECVAVLGFDDPSLLEAPYELIRADKTIDEGVPIDWNNLEIVNRSTREVVAAFNTFTHCFTRTLRHGSEGFEYCLGIYGNLEVEPRCPDQGRQHNASKRAFEKSAFIYSGER